ncbi:hypothetical protein VTK26DRAFT_9069 [Humicola hyalothermophila]
MAVEHTWTIISVLDPGSQSLHQLDGQKEKGGINYTLGYAAQWHRILHPPFLGKGQDHSILIGRRISGRDAANVGNPRPRVSSVLQFALARPKGVWGSPSHFTPPAGACFPTQSNAPARATEVIRLSPHDLSAAGTTFRSLNSHPDGATSQTL